MARIIIRHLSGSKANQVEEFPLNHVKELIFGRDPATTVKYDPDRDDLVGRQHARIAQDQANPDYFLLTDLNSRNGTFLNKQRVTGTTKIAPGDMVQFGPNGPEFVFDVEPRPQTTVKATRIGTDPIDLRTNATPPPTRVPNTPPPMASTSSAPTVGKATVERMIAQNSNKSRTTMIIGGAAVLVLIALVAGGLIIWNIISSNKIKSDVETTLANAAAAAPLSPAEIVNKYSSSVVYIECGWKLIYTASGGQVYHQYIPNRFANGQPIYPDGRQYIAAYVQVGDSIEPLLSLDSRGSLPVGGEHTGSGFAVTSDGFILTNRHVAATWRTSYQFPPSASPGVVIRGGGIALQADGSPLLINAPNDWVPSNTKQDGQKLQGGFEGRNDYLNVTFAKNELRIPAKLARVSDRHDAAMIKIDLPEPVQKVEFNDNYDTIKPGDPTIVLGYPGVSPPVYGVVRSSDVFNRDAKIQIIPDPTVSVGNIGRVIRNQGGNQESARFSSFGDAYQLTINSTGAGNSGGPVFDDRGRVTGIFFAGSTGGGASITFAVPIRYGKELMGVSQAK